MARPSNYPPELRARAVRMVAELTPESPSQYAAITAVAKKLGIGTAETLRKWVRRAEVDAGQRPGTTSAEHAEIKRLKRENAELRRANEILKAASAFFASGPAAGRVIVFIRGHKDRRDGGLRWGVEPICAVLSEHGCRIAPSTYYGRASRGPSRRDPRDEQIAALIEAERERSRFGRVLGSRKMWLRLRGQVHRPPVREPAGRPASGSPRRADPELHYRFRAALDQAG
jgi:transposase